MLTGRCWWRSCASQVLLRESCSAPVDAVDLNRVVSTCNLFRYLAHHADFAGVWLQHGYGIDGNGASGNCGHGRAGATRAW